MNKIVLLSRIYALTILFTFIFCSSSSLKTSSKKSLPLSHLSVPSFEDPVAVMNNSTLGIHTRNEALGQFLEENKPGVLKILLKSCKKYPELLNLSAINFFSEKFYLPSIPLLKSALKKEKRSEYIYTLVFALAQMEDSKTNNFIIRYCSQSKGKTKKGRYSCFLALYDTENKKLQKKAYPLFIKILENTQIQNPASIKLSLDFNKMMIKRKAKALPNKKKLVAKKQRPARKSYKKRLTQTLSLRLGEVNSKNLLSHLDQKIKQYAKKNNDTANFIKKAYRRYYKTRRVSEIDRIMLAGIYQPTSLKVIVNFIKAEYSNKPLQIYGLKQIFDISGIEANTLLSSAKYL